MEKEILLPKALYSRPRSYKGIAIRVLREHIEFIEGMKTDDKKKFYFLTSAGVILADIPVLKDLHPNSFAKTVHRDMAKQVTKLAEDDDEGDETTVTAGGSIALVNVSIKTNAGTIEHFDEFLVFTDDIVGCYFVSGDYTLK